MQEKSTDDILKNIRNIFKLKKENDDSRQRKRRLALTFPKKIIVIIKRNIIKT